MINNTWNVRDRTQRRNRYIFRIIQIKGEKDMLQDDYILRQIREMVRAVMKCFSRWTLRS